jgi:cytochrome b6-f complex iron-sulfur subunit
MSNDTIQDAPSPGGAEQPSFTRRGLVTAAAVAVCGIYAAVIGYPIYKYLESPVDKAIAEAAVNTKELAGADTLPINSTLTFNFKGNPALLIHFADGSWVAISAVCTHLGCTLGYQPPAPLIICPCHGGQYDPHTGKNVGGPPPRPLTRFDVAVQPGKVIITQPEG